MSFQNTISMKEFCRRNCGSMSKEKFYEEYYRIIHTAYLRCEGRPCIETIRDDFENSFGSKLDNISISYIYATTKYLVYDVVVSSLLGDGRIDSQYYYNKLVIDIGFDVWLIKSIESEVRLTMNDFYSWQPLPKNDRTDRQIYDFWHFKLPNSRNFGHLYSAVVPFKKHIYKTYYKLLKANTDYENDPKQLEVLIAFLEEELAKMGEFSAEKTAEPESEPVFENKDTTAVSAVQDSSAEASAVQDSSDGVSGVQDTSAGTSAAPDTAGLPSEEAVAQSVFETELADEVEKAEDQDLSIDEDFIDLDGEIQDKEDEEHLLETEEPADDAADISKAVVPDEPFSLQDALTKELDETISILDGPDEEGPVETAQVEECHAETAKIEEGPVETAQVEENAVVRDEIQCFGPQAPAEKKDDIVEMHTTEDMLAAQPKVNIRVVEPVSEESASTPVPSETEHNAAPEINIAAAPEETFTETAKRISEAAKNFARNTINKVSETANKSVKGFKDGKISITKKKVVTAAVCLALAGTVVVPLAIMFGKGRKR